MVYSVSANVNIRIYRLYRYRTTELGMKEHSPAIVACKSSRSGLFFSLLILQWRGPRPTIFHELLFWVYWCIAALMGLALAAAFIRERDKGVQAVAAMLLVPVILRLLLIK